MLPHARIPAPRAIEGLLCLTTSRHTQCAVQPWSSQVHFSKLCQPGPHLQATYASSGWPCASSHSARGSATTGARSGWRLSMLSASSQRPSLHRYLCQALRPRSAHPSSVADSVDTPCHAHCFACMPPQGSIAGNTSVHSIETAVEVWPPQLATVLRQSGGRQAGADSARQPHQAPDLVVAQLAQQLASGVPLPRAPEGLGGGPHGRPAWLGVCADAGGHLQQPGPECVLCQQLHSRHRVASLSCMGSSAGREMTKSKVAYTPATFSAWILT